MARMLLAHAGSPPLARHELQSANALGSAMARGSSAAGLLLSVWPPETGGCDWDKVLSPLDYGWGPGMGTDGGASPLRAGDVPGGRRHCHHRDAKHPRQALPCKRTPAPAPRRRRGCGQCDGNCVSKGWRRGDLERAIAGTLFAPPLGETMLAHRLAMVQDERARIVAHAVGGRTIARNTGVGPKAEPTGSARSPAWSN